MRLNEEQCKRIADHAFSKFPISIDFTVDGMNKAVNKLPKSQREYITLRFINNLTYKDIAERTGKSTTCARESIEKSMRTLRQPEMKFIIEGREPMAIDDDTPLSMFTFSVRVYNALGRVGIRTFGELKQLSYNQLIKVRNIGKSGVREVKGFLSMYGINLEVPNENNNPVIRLTIPKDRINSGIVSVKFIYDKDTGDCTILSVNNCEE